MRIMVVGAGFSGATIARVLAEQGYSIDLIDRRSHVAGNAYDHVNEYGIRVHDYGPHLFHTSNQRVVEFLSRFTEWTPYKHKVKAMLADGRLVTLPVNRETCEIVGKENVLDTFFRPYTKKMWGISLDELDPEILNRVPVRDDANEFYFPNDQFQALPKSGYSTLVENMIDHPLINVTLNEGYQQGFAKDYIHIFNSMSLDEFFNNEHGVLPYRSIRFHTMHAPCPRFFPVATVNFTHEEKYTRVTEWKNLPGHGQNASHTTLTFEEPCDFSENNFERYYPVKDLGQENRALYKKYAAMTPANMTFIGRCGLYAYIDMHQAVNSALSIANDFLEKMMERR